MLGTLGYNFNDPHEVQPEYAADFRTDQTNRVDFAIMRDGVPVIVVECKKVGSELSANRGQLRSYFSALQTVKLGFTQTECDLNSLSIATNQTSWMKSRS